MNSNKSSMMFFLTRCLFSGFGLSFLYNIAEKDAYIGSFLGMIMGLFIIFLYGKINELKGDKSLKELFKNNKIVGIITRIFFIIVSILILLYILIIYNVFIVGFLLVNSPEIYVTIPFMVLVTYAVFKGIKVINRLADSLLFLSLAFILIILISLGGFIEFTNVLPIMATKSSNIFKTAIIFAGISTFPNIFYFHVKSDLKSMIKTYIASSLSLILAAFFVCGVLGEKLVDIFRFPEYMVLKQIKLFQFIEKVENILSLVWVLDLFVSAIMALYSIKELLPSKKNKITTIALVILIVYIIDKFLSFNYVYELIFYHLLPYISIIVPIILIILMYILVKKKNCN